MSLEATKKEFIENVARNYAGGYNTYFCVVNDSGNFFYQDICYRALMGTSCPYGGSSAVLSRFKKGALTEDQEREFLHYMLNESTYASSFLEHDVDEVLKTRVICSRTDVPSAYMQGALVHLRQCWESSGTIVNWLALVKAGFEKNLAFCLAHFIYVDVDSFNTYGITTGHRIWSNTTINYAHICNYVKGVMRNHKPFNKSPSFTNNHKLFWDKNTADNTSQNQCFATQDAFKKWVKDSLTETSSKKKYGSPFGAALEKQQTATQGDTRYPVKSLEILAKKQQEFLDLCQERAFPKEKVA